MSRNPNPHLLEWLPSPGAPTLADLGEMEILERIRRWLEARSHVGTAEGFLSLGAGDDAALVRPQNGSQIVLTCDIHVEDVHFRCDLLTPRDVGRRVMVSNISDVAAMGARPRAALISLALPASDPEYVLFDILLGLADELEESGGVIAGGNLATTSGARIVDVTLVGDLRDQPFLRSGAEVGDHVVLIGNTGESAAGLWCLEQLASIAGTSKGATKGASRPRAWKPPESLMQSYIRPRHRLEESCRLRVLGGVKALIDTSDGLLSDLNHICEAGGVGAEIDTAALPVSLELKEAAKRAGRSPLEWVLGPSDDYALLAAVRAESTEGLLSGMEQARRIGYITEGSGVCVKGDGTEGIRGWDHFKLP